eukprot:6911648-Alexandrium_andersonii.AAC.1
MAAHTMLVMLLWHGCAWVRSLRVCWHGCARVRWLSLCCRPRARCALWMHDVACRTLRLQVALHAVLGCSCACAAA